MAPNCGNQTCLALCYDILAQVISILDVATDVIVCIQYYENDRMVFFGISLTILLLALIAYDIAFVFSIENETKAYKHLLMFLVVLPFSPFVPYLMYFIANNDSFVAEMLESICCFQIHLQDRISAQDNVSKLRQFMEQKLQRHLGFLIEALVEGMNTM